MIIFVALSTDYFFSGHFTRLAVADCLLEDNPAFYFWAITKFSLRRKLEQPIYCFPLFRVSSILDVLF